MKNAILKKEILVQSIFTICSLTIWSCSDHVTIPTESESTEFNRAQLYEDESPAVIAESGVESESDSDEPTSNQIAEATTSPTSSSSSSSSPTFTSLHKFSAGEILKNFGGLVGFSSTNSSNAIKVSPSIAVSSGVVSGSSASVTGSTAVTSVATTPTSTGNIVWSPGVILNGVIMKDSNESFTQVHRLMTLNKVDSYSESAGKMTLSQVAEYDRNGSGDYNANLRQTAIIGNNKYVRFYSGSIYLEDDSQEDGCQVQVTQTFSSTESDYSSFVKGKRAAVFLRGFDMRYKSEGSVNKFRDAQSSVFLEGDSASKPESGIKVTGLTDFNGDHCDKQTNNIYYTLMVYDPSYVTVNTYDHDSNPDLTCDADSSTYSCVGYRSGAIAPKGSLSTVDCSTNNCEKQSLQIFAGLKEIGFDLNDNVLNESDVKIRSFASGILLYGYNQSTMEAEVLLHGAIKYEHKNTEHLAGSNRIGYRVVTCKDKNVCRAAFTRVTYEDIKNGEVAKDTAVDVSLDGT